MAYSFEHKIRFKISLIFFVVTAYFGAVFVYLERMNKTIDEQRLEVEDLSEIVTKTNALISSIQEAQNITNSYLFSHKKSDLALYETTIGGIDRQIEELDALSTNQNRSGQLLREVRQLLEKKNEVVVQLSTQFNRQNPMKDLRVKIDSIQENVKETIEVTIRHDSLTLPSQHLPAKKRNLWSRIKNVFNPSEIEADTTVRIVDVGTTHKTSIDTAGVFRDLRATTNQLNKNYQRKISAIEERVRQLVIADADIFAQISQLLTRFHEETIQSVFARTNANEELTRKVFRFAMNSGALSLLLILFIIILIAGDLNKGRKASRDLIKEKQRTEDLTKSRHILLLAVSHDIKTPLSSMMGYMDLWRAEETDVSKRRQLQSALNSGQHILTMLTNLLEYSRLEKQAFRPKESVFNISELCRNIIEMFHPLANEKRITLHYANLVGDGCFVQSDYTAVKQVLSNIVSNAVKYTVDGGVELLLEEKEGKIQFVVSDSGVGIDTAKTENAFRPFSRMDNPVSVEGSGFGLYVTKGLVDAMGGCIGITSQKGKGTTVIVIMPLKKATVPETRNLTPVSGRPKKILIFEDDDSLAHVLVEMIRRMGHKAELCSYRDLPATNISLFDFIFTDMEMGEVTGTDILQTIRETDGKIPVWLLTAHGDITDSDARKVGFSGLITKPVTISALENIVLLPANLAGNEKNNGEENDEFPSLSALFEGDSESINDILRHFITTAEEDLAQLQVALQKSDFAKTRQICHKILPFLMQLGSPRIQIQAPQKMNQLKDGEEAQYPGWQTEIKAFATNLHDFVHWIRRDYLADS